MKVGDLVVISDHWKLKGTIGAVAEIHGATSGVRVRYTILMANGKKDWFYNDELRRLSCK